ncbi:sigma-70 family RNA polymerase sigma factor [Microlunatus parietis]|uniref:RNA polymerase sigma-70 factor (ECF subfamily) n=1 Tax=Microlunatus parietis TaxID=682979 RepID=A0A7Y9I8V2_9ACTN|nr:sigma-70 family RNA polymerase sigma factor [Microlunatus parietis]NYE72474.1 RNA polymerase sigma-70 factor (ECF subfamily) [Microlunatus parietis]
MASDGDVLATAFEENRPRLRNVAYRILGSTSDAEDAVQEAWLRLNRSEAERIDNLGGWLTTVVSRICLDQLRSRTARREDSLDVRPVEPAEDEEAGPEEQAVQADAMGAALMVVLDTLAPAERMAFVLHDLFGVPFDEIATIVDKTPAATRQLASRARRRVRGGPPEEPPGGDGRRHQGRETEVVSAFFDAARNANFDRLLELLDPDVVLRADAAAVLAATRFGDRGAPRIAAELRGSEAVASALSGTARGAQLALVDGYIGATYAPGGRPISVFELTVRNGRITGIELYADRELVDSFSIEIID